MCACRSVLVEGRGPLVGVLFSPSGSWGGQIQVASLGGELPYPWSQLTGPTSSAMYNVPVTVNFPP